MAYFTIRRGVSACALIVSTLPFHAQAQEALPPIDVGSEKKETKRAGGAGPLSSSEIPEGSYVAPAASSGTKTDTPLMETPLNVQVITPQQLQDRQITRVQDAVKYVSGVTTGQPASLGFSETIHLRGFDAPVLRNGFRQDLLLSTDFNFSNIDRVEVLKGSSAIMYGLVEPGGMVNYITKQPSEKPSYSLQQQIGSFDYYRTTAGATGPLTTNGSLLYRLDLSYENNRTFVDLEHKQNLLVAPVVRWNISPSTQVNFELNYANQANSNRTDVIPTYNGQKLQTPWSRNYGDPAPLTSEEILLGVYWSHKFDEDWTLSHQIQFMTKDGHAHGNQTPVFIDDGANPIFVPPGSNSVYMIRYGQNFDYEEDAFATQANLVGHFNTGELKHTLLTGADFYRFNSYYSLGLAFPSSWVDLFDPVHPGVSFGNEITQAYKITATGYHFGAYVQDQIELPFHLHLMGGVRYQDYTRLFRDPDFRADGSLGLSPQPTINATRVTPRVGVLWRPVEWFSAYGNYSEGFGPNEGSLIWPNLPAPPSDARQFELGVKLELFDGRLRMSADYFELAKTNVPTGDPAHPGYSLIIGEVTTKGPELDVTGEIMPGWNVILSYANMEARVTKSNDGDIGNRFPNQPRNVASLWSTYEVKEGDLRGLHFGGGVKYQDEQPMINFSGVKSPWPSLPPVATLDLMAGYKFEIEGAKVNAQINVTNLLDHHYYTIGQVTGYRPGWSFQYTNRAEPQKFMGSVSVAF